MRSASVFDHELHQIISPGIREFAAKMLEQVPEAFYMAPASMSGKYHPQYALGEGGLVRHTKAAVKIAVSLLSLEQNADLARNYHDAIISALILHDGMKVESMEWQYSTIDHATQMADKIRKYIKENENSMSDSFRWDFDVIANLVERHMGEWNKDRQGEVIAHKPHTEAEKFVHLCDYLASRRWIEIDTSFDI